MPLVDALARYQQRHPGRVGADRLRGELAGGGLERATRLVVPG